MAENGENAVAIPPNSETNTVVETTEIIQSLPVSEISQGNENNTMDIVSMALSNVTETANLMTVVDSNVVTEVEDVEEVQQFEQIEVVEQQVVQEIPIGSDDMVITTADGQIILPSNSTPEELSAVETLVGGALQQTVVSHPVAHPVQVEQATEYHQYAGSSSQGEPTVVSVVDASNPGIVTIGGGAQGISASSLLGSIATMIDSTESTIQASGSSSALQFGGMKINTSTPAQVAASNIVHRTVPTDNLTLVGSSISNNVCVANNATSIFTTAAGPAATTNATAIGLKSVLAPSQSSSLPSTITIKTPPGSNSVSQSLLNSILNNADVQSLLRRNPGQPITIVRVPEDSPSGKNINKITVTTGLPAKKPPFQPTQGSKTYMRITTPLNKSSPTTVKSQPNTPNNSNPKRRPGRPPKVKEPPPEPIVVKSKKTRSGRVSRPPIHRVRDYKTIHIQEMGEPDDEKDDFTDYDGELLKNSHSETLSNYGGRSRDFKCDKCDKAYIGKAGLGRHFKNNPDHGDPSDLGITYDDEEETTPPSVQVTPAKTFHTPPFRRKRRGRPPAPRPPNGDPDFTPNKRIPSKTSGAGKSTYDLGAQALHRRKQRIQELIKTIGDEDLMELALPRLSKAITVWEFLLMKVEEAHSQKLPIQEILQHFESVQKHVRLFADECLERVSAKCESKQRDASEGVHLEEKTQRSQDTGNTSNNEPSTPSEVQSGNENKTQESQDIGILSNNELSTPSEFQTDNDKKTQESQEIGNSSNTEPSKGSEVHTDIDQASGETQKLTDGNAEDTERCEKNKKEEEPSPNEGDQTSETRTLSGESATDTEMSSFEDAKTQVTENGDAMETCSNTEQSAVGKVDTLTKRTETDDDEKVDDASVKETDSKEDKENEGKQAEDAQNIMSRSSEDDAKNSASKSETEITDFLELEEDMAKALGMEVGKYKIKDWTLTKLPAMYRFSKKVTEEEDFSPSEEEPEEVETPAKRQRVDEAMAAAEVSSSSSPGQVKQVTKIQLPKEESSKEPVPGTKMQLVVHTNSNEYKPATVPMSLKSVTAAGDAVVTSTANKQQQQFVQPVVTSPQAALQQVEEEDEEEPQPMEIEQGNQVVHVQSEEIMAEETSEAAVVNQKEEEQGHASIVPEGSTIMQMEDGTFLVQKPDGTAMQIHCPDGMTIETIQALLSMDAGNLLQAAE